MPCILASCGGGDSPTGSTTGSTPDAAAGAFTWSEAGSARNGVVQAHSQQAGGTASQYSVVLNAWTAAGGSVTNNDLITITLINITGPGTYTFGINTSTGVLASATLNRNRVGSPTAIWGAGPGLAGGQGSGSVTISSFNATARTIAGTFSFVGGPVTNTGSVNTVTITNGTFNVTIPR